MHIHDAHDVAGQLVSILAELLDSVMLIRVNIIRAPTLQ
jgi:hypothetical protein